MRRLPLRWMLLLPILVMVSAGFAALAIYVVGTTRSELIATVDVELQRAGQRGAPPSPAIGGGTGQPDTTDDLDAPLEFTLRDSTVILGIFDAATFTPEQLASLVDTEGIRTLSNNPRYRVRTATNSRGEIVVTALPLDRADATVSALQRNLFLGGIVIFALESLVVWIIATLATRPVTRMTSAASSIAHGALDTEIGRPTGPRETAALAEDLQHMLDQLRATLDHQQQAAAEATQARDDMRRFLADASHELRTPLTAIKGYSDLYRGQMLEERADLDRAMDRIGSESERLSGLVEGMLRLARPDSAVPMDREVIDLADIVANVGSDLRAAYPSCQITITQREPPQVSQVVGDRAQLHQALLNLGANACQHGGEKPEVTLSVTSLDGDVAAAVQDSGPGLAPDTLTNIFLPFFRMDSSRSRTGSGGAGLGLTLAKHIAEAHDGSITVDSAPGIGSTFLLTIPAASPHDAVTS